MKARLLSCFLFAIAAIFPLALSAQGPVFAKANITLVDGVLTIDESDPTAIGLMFKFGSVVGLSAVDNAYQPFDSETDILFDPTYPSKAPYKRWQDVPHTRGDEIKHTHSNVLSGKGDPCRLVGLTPEQIRSGEIDNGKWRLPTGREYERLVRKHKQSIGHRQTALWIDKPAGVVMEGVFFPAVGNRNDPRGGMTMTYGWRGAYMSSQGDNDFFIYNLRFSHYDYTLLGSFETYSYENTLREISRGAYSVRCVRQ